MDFPTKHRIRLASYNIRKARGLDGKRDPGRVVDIVARLGADVVALQEADRRLGERPAAVPREMIEKETDFRVLDVAKSDVSLGWHGNAVLVRKDLEVSGVTALDLPGLEPRGAVRIDLGGFAPMTFVATHLGLTRRHRRLQMQAILDQIPDDQPCAVMGDFNEWSRKKGFEPFDEMFEVLSPGRSFHAARPIAALDRIAFSSELKVTDAGVEEGKQAKKASDHLPIWSDIEVPALF